MPIFAVCENADFCDFCTFRGWKNAWETPLPKNNCKFFWRVRLCNTNRTRFSCREEWKIILAVWKMVVSLHSLSKGKRRWMREPERKWEDIETDGKRDSVCHLRLRSQGRTRERVKGRKSISRNSYNEEFDPGSGWTLAAGLTHASRGAAGSSNTPLATGARVRNAYATYP